ncbi:DUF3330 domain-containing protein [Sulfurivermis fontis]|uniref:DUF3330 domain-containing protein n=1 Tax=Sulfurivermis fontis TaxID=1972068 RepID=UPI000FDB668D|nr:DUF3330 domain-containing protein [Sulfurivermis fontis]
MYYPNAEKPFPSEPEPIQCEICLHDIPASVAVTVEGCDYVHHYCGLDCLARWSARVKLPEYGSN